MHYRFRDSWFVRAGVLTLVLGFGPLFMIMAVVTLGLSRDPNPNPIGPGLLAFFSFYPGMGLILFGLLSVIRKNRQTL